ncbi:MAG TPA: SMC-Scp complex subunit ScpB [Thermomicrobiales bacterium]|nr:SMC-Scp complex subunit ScpB [Thermomicrobiales bacterium]
MADPQSPSERQSQLSIEVLDGPDPGPELTALIEALLLVAPEPVTIADLAQGAGVKPDAVETTLESLSACPDRGWVIQRHGETVQLTTAPRFAPQVRRFLGLDREVRLSTAALETLAIIGYQQPVTRAEVEAVRGVDSSGVIATLLSRGLIEIVGRVASPGMPFQYGTTPSFLLHFGLRSLADLPPLGQVEGRDASTALQAAIASADLAGSVADEGNPEHEPEELE